MADKRLAKIDAIKDKEILVEEYTSAINDGLELGDLYEDVAKFIHLELFQ
ncbi:hypothetical protein JUJ52_09975 [Virgibacillus sp. AGTR]|nr:hypothetical protein [Virgibacillus sp. AGTR]MCC2250292.1 hypothetical protein [Virgibacillus sp. AGTR]